MHAFGALANDAPQHNKTKFEAKAKTKHKIGKQNTMQKTNSQTKKLKKLVEEKENILNLVFKRQTFAFLLAKQTNLTCTSFAAFVIT